MLTLTGEARFADVLEQSLYNAVLAGIGLDGTRFFYTNTLRQLDEMPTELRWSRQRQPFISCFCCPPNVARTIAEASSYAYGRSDGRRLGPPLRREHARHRARPRLAGSG